MRTKKGVVKFSARFARHIFISSTPSLQFLCSPLLKAVSFAGIQEMFHKSKISNYAYLYTLQSLKEGAPSFCLGCIGIDNSFTAARVLKLWQYIHSELKRRGIEVINFAADGDSRLLSSMRAVMNMTSQPACKLNFENIYSNIKIPIAIQKWLFVKQIPLCTRHCAHWCETQIKATKTINYTTNGFLHSNQLSSTYTG